MSSDFIDLGSIQCHEECRPELFRFVDQANVSRWVDRCFLLSCFSIILLVSAADTWFAYLNEDIIFDEKNPICLWLLQMEPASCGCFVAGKICGTLLVLSISYSLLRAKYRHARTVIAAVTAFQLGLLAYLCLSDAQMNGWINLSLLFDEAETSIFPTERFGVNIFHGNFRPQ